MRAYELYETTESKPQITLRQLNRLKHIRRRNKMAQEEKAAMLPVMYSGARLEELEELENDISAQIHAAKIDQEQKDHIRDMALNTIKNQDK